MSVYAYRSVSSAAMARPRILGGFGLLFLIALTLTGASLLLHKHHEAAALLAAALFLPLLAVLATTRDTKKNRGRALYITALMSAGAVAVIAKSGDAGVVLVLVAPTLSGILTFGRSRKHRTLEGIRRFRGQTFSRYESVIVAVVPAFAVGVLLVNHRDLSGSALAALLLAPWLYCLPTINVFTDSWSQHSRHRHLLAQRDLAETAEADLHGRFYDASTAIGRALEALEAFSVSEDIKERLLRFYETCRTAQETTLRDFGLSDDDLVSLGFLSGGPSLIQQPSSPMEPSLRLPRRLPVRLRLVVERLLSLTDSWRDLHCSPSRRPHEQGAGGATL